MEIQLYTFGGKPFAVEGSDVRALVLREEKYHIHGQFIDTEASAGNFIYLGNSKQHIGYTKHDCLVTYLHESEIPLLKFSRVSSDLGENHTTKFTAFASLPLLRDLDVPKPEHPDYYLNPKHILGLEGISEKPTKRSNVRGIGITLIALDSIGTNDQNNGRPHILYVDEPYEEVIHRLSQTPYGHNFIKFPSWKLSKYNRWQHALSLNKDFCTYQDQGNCTQVTLRCGLEGAQFQQDILCSLSLMEFERLFHPSPPQASSNPYSSDSLHP